MLTYKAEMFVAPEKSEVIGFAILSMHQSLESNVVNPILHEYDLTAENIAPDGWYPLQILYDVYRDIMDNHGGTMALTAMGKAVAEPLLSNFEVSDVETFFGQRINELVRASIRNLPDDYGYIVEPLGPTAYRVTNNTGTPNEFIYGYLWDVMRILMPKGSTFRVLPVANFDEGNTGATFEISWE